MIKAYHDRDRDGIFVFDEGWDEDVPGRADIRIGDSQELADFLEALLECADELNWTGFGSPVYNFLASRP